MGHILKDLMLLHCKTYEDYLDHYISKEDARYLRNVTASRKLVTLGYRSRSKIYNEEEFEKRKKRVLEHLHPIKTSHGGFSEGVAITDPVLKELARRELPNMEKNMSTIIFMKYHNKAGFEISGYIDFENSLRHTINQSPGCRNWKEIFEQKQLLRPRASDLSFYDWHQGRVVINDSSNYRIYNDVENGIMFMFKGDRKMICPDVHNRLYEKNCISSMHFSDLYGHVAFYDHMIRKKM